MDNSKNLHNRFLSISHGTTREGIEIAVKKLSLESRQGKNEFLNEVKLVAKVQHRNLVKSLGCCQAGSERLLVYEYLPNNNLDKIIFVPDRRRQRDWQRHCSIILGITRGLLYLHEDSHLRIIHRDIKASNILLDKNLNPKIADFGLARLFEEDETSVGTGIARTRGDATVEECYNCSRQAKIDVLHYCGNYVGCNVWSKFCFLRYNGNYNFTGHMDTFGDNYFNDFNASADPAAYTDAARQLLSDLSSKITSGSATNRYASGSIVDSGQFHTIYGLAQCWGDISLADCKTCLSTKIDHLFKYNTGRLGARGLARSCIIQYDANIFFNPSPSPPPQINVPPASPPEKSSNKIPIIFGVIGGFLLLLIIFLFGIRKKFKYALFGSRHGGYYEGQDDSGIRENQQQASEGLVLARIPSLSIGFTVFEMETLIAATENFHDNNKLGEGGFGAVYKGTTPEGKEIAVKKLSLESRQGKKEFLNEVKLVAKVQHRNLVKLLGCCEAGSERLLVYEYLPNNSLDKILFIPDRRRQLDWQKRCSIILGITRGLLYLHEDSHLRIIHRDIKASNILLDKNLNPKIADFGLARLFEEDETSVGTGIAGTRGYMAPEYAMHGQLSAKADVYSFGILLLELISGKRNTDFNLPPEMQILLQWTWGLYTRGNIEAIVDPVINETCGDQTEVLRCVHVALLCTQGSPLLRPSMSTVNLMLSTGAMLLPDPTKPAFVSSVAASNNPGSSQHGSSHTSAATASSSSHTPLASNANVSISELEPR